MAQTPDLKRLIEVGQEFTEMRRSQARRIVSDLVKQGQIARDQAAGAVEELLDASRRRSDDLRDLIRSEVQRQLRALGVATRDDLDRLERRMRADASKGAAAKAPAKRTAVKKTSSAKGAARKAPAKKAPAKAAGRAS